MKNKSKNQTNQLTKQKHPSISGEGLFLRKVERYWNCLSITLGLLDKLWLLWNCLEEPISLS